MKYFLGLDVALANNGICLLDEGSNIILSKVIETKSIKNTEERIIYITNMICEIIDKYDIGFITLEGLSYSSNGKSFAQICGMHFYLRCALYEKYNNIKLKIIEPTKLKKFITGKGQCKKDLILLYTYKNFGVEFDDNNLADAFGLAKMALEEYNKK